MTASSFLGTFFLTLGTPKVVIAQTLYSLAIRVHTGGVPRTVPPVHTCIYRNSDQSWPLRKKLLIKSVQVLSAHVAYRPFCVSNYTQYIFFKSFVCSKKKKIVKERKTKKDPQHHIGLFIFIYIYFKSHLL